MNNRLVLKLREKAYKKASARAISLPYEMKTSEFDTMFQEMFVESIVHDFLSELTNDDSLGKQRVATIKRLANKWGVANV
jgi:hypothetical protein